MAGEKMHYVGQLQLMNKCSLCSYIIIYQGPQSHLKADQTFEKSWEELVGFWWRSGVEEEEGLRRVYLS